MKNIFKSQDFQKIKVLGQGTYGKCYLVNNIHSNQLCVLKQIEIGGMTQQEIEQTMKQARILEALDHPNIIKCIEAYIENSVLNIVMDYADAGDLSRKIKNAKGNYFSQNQILNWFTQICLAIKHVHDRKIIHRDLKSQNIFLTSQNLVKLGDFGIAKPLQMTLQKIKTVVGTPYYMSPQICQNKQYSLKTDIWSLGVILYEICALKPPFDANSLPALALKISRGQYGTVPPHYSKQLKKIISDLLQVQPSKRPNINQILKYNLLKCRIDNFLPQGIRQRQFSHTTLHSQNIFQRQDLKKEIAKLANQQPQLNSIISPRSANNNSGHMFSNHPSHISKSSNSIQSNRVQSKQQIYNMKQKNLNDKKKKLQQKQRLQYKKREISQPLIVTPKNNQKKLKNNSSLTQLQKKRSQQKNNNSMISNQFNNNSNQFFKKKRISEQYQTQLSQIKQLRGECMQLHQKIYFVNEKQRQKEVIHLDLNNSKKYELKCKEKQENSNKRLVNNWIKQEQQQHEQLQTSNKLAISNQSGQQQSCQVQNIVTQMNQSNHKQNQLSKCIQSILLKMMTQKQLSKAYSQIQQNHGFVLSNKQNQQMENKNYGLVSLLYGINRFSIMEIK